MEEQTKNIDENNTNSTNNSNYDSGNSNAVVDGFPATFGNKKTIKNIPVAPHPDAECYLKNKNRGIALIFNYKNFSNANLSTREGTDKDRDDLKEIFWELKFDVKVYDDLTYEETMEVLEIVSKMDHTDFECLIIAVMSHGENEILYAKDIPFWTNKLWTKFSPLHCPSLAGKPKIFLIQACRGDKTDPGVDVSYIESDSSKSIKNLYSIPVMADILIMYATVEGYFAWRDPTKGSYFIQALVNQLRKHHHNRDLLSILTCVNREVAIGFTSGNSTNPDFNRKKEMCSIVSMLTRAYYFNS